MKEDYIARINELLDKSNNIEMLDFIFQLLMKERKSA